MKRENVNDATPLSYEREVRACRFETNDILNYLQDYYLHVLFLHRKFKMIRNIKKTSAVIY